MTEKKMKGKISGKRILLAALAFLIIGGAFLSHMHVEHDVKNQGNWEIAQDAQIQIILQDFNQDKDVEENVEHLRQYMEELKQQGAIKSYRMDKTHHLLYYTDQTGEENILEYYREGDSF